MNEITAIKVQITADTVMHFELITANACRIYSKNLTCSVMYVATLPRFVPIHVRYQPRPVVTIGLVDIPTVVYFLVVNAFANIRQSSFVGPASSLYVHYSLIKSRPNSHRLHIPLNRGL